MRGSANPGNIFPAILASTVHDIKNSLGIVLELIRQLAVNQLPCENEEFTQLEFEANRINHSLIQLLVMYKIDTSKFGLDIEEYSALDIVNEAIAQQHALAKFKQVQLHVNCDDKLMCYCDFPNICNALGTILNNALRYTRSAIQFSAVQEGEYLKFCIEDDGLGYSEHLLSADLSVGNNMDWVTGNTGLGLYFVAMIASMHKNNGKSGFVSIDNQSSLGGARFSLFLP